METRITTKRFSNSSWVAIYANGKHIHSVYPIQVNRMRYYRSDTYPGLFNDMKAVRQHTQEMLKDN